MLHRSHKVSDTWKTALPWTPVNILAILLDQTMNTHFLSTLQWHTLLIGSTRITIHPWNMPHHCCKALRHLEKQYRYCCEASQCSGHLYCIRPWIHTFWAIAVVYSGTWCCLSQLGTLLHMEWMLYHGQEGFWHLENQYCHEQQSTFWPFFVARIITTHFGPTSWCFCSAFTTW